MLLSRGSKNVPLPIISRFATNAFQCVTEPQPVYVCSPTPARPNAAGNSVAAVLPSAEPLAVHRQLGVEPARAPGRQHLLHRVRVDLQQVGERRQIGRQRDDRADVEIAVRRQPSSRLPMPGANESSTVE
jgi:hypothetical protein